MDTKFHDIVDIFHVIDVIIFYISKMMNPYLILEILNAVLTIGNGVANNF